MCSARNMVEKVRRGGGREENCLLMHWTCGKGKKGRMERDVLVNTLDTVERVVPGEHDRVFRHQLNFQVSRCLRICHIKKWCY